MPPAAAAKRPNAQPVHEEPAASAKRPAPHWVQRVNPVTVDTNPGAHGWHASMNEFDVALKRPAAHLTHAVASAVTNDPAAHPLHTEAPCAGV